MCSGVGFAPFVFVFFASVFFVFFASVFYVFFASVFFHVPAPTRASDTMLLPPRRSPNVTSVSVSAAVIVRAFVAVLAPRRHAARSVPLLGTMQFTMFIYYVV